MEDKMTKEIQYKEILDFFGIELLDDGSVQFKPAIMHKWRLAQHNRELEGVINIMNKIEAEKYQLNLENLAQSDLIAKLEAENVGLKSEIAWVDEALARRPGLAQFENRYDAICASCRAVTKLEAENAKLRKALTADAKIF